MHSAFNLEINARKGFMKYGGLELSDSWNCVFEVLISMISANTRICVDSNICILTHIWTVGSKDT